MYPIEAEQCLETSKDIGGPCRCKWHDDGDNRVYEPYASFLSFFGLWKFIFEFFENVV